MRMASVDQGGDVLIWDWLQKRAMMTLRGHGQRPGGIDFSPDGRQLAVVNQKLWIYHTDPWSPPGHAPKRPEPVKLDIKPIPEAAPEAKKDATF